MEFWKERPDILWQGDQLTHFFPTKDQSLEDKLNSITRLGIYISIVLCVYHKSSKYGWIGIATLLFTYFIYTFRPTKPVDVAATAQADTTVSKIEGLDATEACTPPTLDNPYMNVTMKDYMNIQDGKIVDRPPACDISDPKVKEAADNFFNNDLYKDVNDLFGKMNSQRQFFTMPYTTIPNKQDEFARWLYGSPPTCKENQDHCVGYEDLRAKSAQGILYNPKENPVDTKKMTKKE